MEPRKTMRVIVEGRVQGVWFRGWTVEAANAHGLDGWVRNLSDGRVEAVFSGPAERVDRMVQACRAGPPAADVKRVSAEPWAEHPGHGFHQRPTV
ncbi:acylphosphatase [Magnetospirillum sp. UT-4]|uniref:acylphosphatase n=1 Tax=Magnetospirillum sp. UT-4 TaxID=2681467 RepID=UPI0013848464|nr:acylphosphatase [Magnetospirillum sp. UT-4]CAA7619709.1 Acylphosphatase [Magnetospirillum sp. UT-4]